jgi:hypothetical protein
MLKYFSKEKISLTDILMIINSNDNRFLENETRIFRSTFRFYRDYGINNEHVNSMCFVFSIRDKSLFLANLAFKKANFVHDNANDDVCE